jgi:hypothetical protein
MDGGARLKAISPVFHQHAVPDELEEKDEHERNHERRKTSFVIHGVVATDHHMVLMQKASGPCRPRKIESCYSRRPGM